jgi:DNA-binding MarR family transcriptional regulator
LSPIEAKRLDPVVHERLRLGILSALAVTDGLSFTELRSILETSDGNVSVHCRRLEEAGYISVQKSFEGRIPKTRYSITAAGRRALTGYLEAMQQFILSFNRS